MKNRKKSKTKAVEEEEKNTSNRYIPPLRDDGSVDIAKVIQELEKEENELEGNACWNVTMIVCIATLIITVPFFTYHFYDDLFPKALHKDCPSGMICNPRSVRNPRDNECPIKFPNTLLFMYTPNTKGKTITRALEERSKNKGGFSVNSFPEWVYSDKSAKVLVDVSNITIYQEMYSVRLRTVIQKNRKHIRANYGKIVIEGKYFYQRDVSKPLSEFGTDTEKVILKVAGNSFSNLDTHPAPEVGWITMLRNPISRLRKQYSRYHNHSKPLLTLDECIQDPSCVFQESLHQWCNVQVSSICGYDPECSSFPLSMKAIQKAKSHLEQNFLVFGITEKLNQSLGLFRSVLPLYFEKAFLNETNIDLSLNDNNNNNNNNNNSEDSSSTLHISIKNAYQDVCGPDIELYEFAKEIFNKRVNSCPERIAVL